MWGLGRLSGGGLIKGGGEMWTRGSEGERCLGENVGYSTGISCPGGSVKMLLSARGFQNLAL